MKLIKNKKIQRPVIETVLSSMDQFTNAEVRAAQILLNQPMIGLETISEFAQKVNVSSPSILRLARKLGFEGYTQFQIQLRKDLEQRLASPLTKIEKQKGKFKTSQNAFVNQIVNEVCSNIKQSFENIPDKELSATVKLLQDHKRNIFMIGGRLTDALAQYFYLHLHTLRSHVKHIIGQNSNWPEQVLDIKKNDVICVFDIRRYQTDLQKFANDAYSRGAIIVLFTDQWVSPISPISKHIFCMKTELDTVWDSSASMIALLDLLISLVNEKNFKNIEKRVNAMEDLRHTY